jgi:hypothetical protein
LIEILEYQNASKIELGIDDIALTKLRADLFELLADETGSVEDDLDNIFEILRNYGIVIR